MSKSLHSRVARLLAFLGVAAAATFLFGVAAVAASPITNLDQGKSYESLATALGEARSGDTIEIAGGTWSGNFVIDHALTLRGVAGATLPVLDGAGSGVVLTIQADDVTVENLAIRHSGTAASTPWSLWGDAGVLVVADRATLRGLQVSDNDWGIVLKGRAGSTIEQSVIEDNVHQGVKVMGGRDHVIADNQINRNSSGISVDALFGDLRESPVARLGERDAQGQLVAMKQISLVSRNVRIAGNEIRGNGFYGIEIAWKSEHIAVENNHVWRTGVDRPVDQALISTWEQTVSGSMGVPVTLSRDAYGSGIFLFCLANNNTIVGNTVADNVAYGIGLSLVSQNDVKSNGIAGNRVGIALASASDNRITRNLIADNSAFGIRIDVSSVTAVASSGNLLVRNDISGSAVNAFDSSGRALTLADMDTLLEAIPWPEEVRKQMKSSPQMRQMMLQTYLAQLKPGVNRWDDGACGNRYGDFDEASEGFLDRNNDGLGEAAYPIAGGPSIDSHPVAASAIEDMRLGA